MSEHQPPIDCETCLELAFDLMHDELDAATRRSAHAHLADCAACALASCRLRAELDELVSSQAVAPPARVKARLDRAVQRRFGPGRTRRAWSWLSTPLPAYALAVLLAVPTLAWVVHATRSPGASWRSEAAPAETTSGDRPRLEGYDASRYLGSTTVVF